MKEEVNETIMFRGFIFNIKGKYIPYNPGTRLQPPEGGCLEDDFEIFLIANEGSPVDFLNLIDVIEEMGISNFKDELHNAAIDVFLRRNQ